MKSYTMALLSAVLVSHASGIALNTGQKESHPTYSLVEKVRKKKNDDVDFAALGGLFGGLAGVIGESVGGEAGRQINNTGKLVSGVSTTAANGGSSGDIVAALASGAGNFSLDSNIAWKLEDAGKAIGGSIDSLDAGDVGGALHSFSGATSQIPGVGGDIMSLTANSLGDIVNAGKENDATSIVGSLGNMTGSIAGNFGGPTGAIIQNLTPTAQLMTDEAQQGNTGNVIGLGLSGIGSQLHNEVASVALQTAGQTAGIAVDQAIAGNDSTALIAGLTTLTNTGQAINQVVNPNSVLAGVPSVNGSGINAPLTNGITQANAIAIDQQTGLTSFVKLEPDSIPNLSGTTKFLVLSP